jgi:peptidoglycan/xylan/chitin deacetylase (PgdA/CDA1 family)
MILFPWHPEAQRFSGERIFFDQRQLTACLRGLDSICEDRVVSGRVAPRWRVRTAVLLGVVVVPTLVSVCLVESPHPLPIMLDGHPVLVPASSHLGETLRRFGLGATDGRLLDIEGHVLVRHADPGFVLLNGAVASPRARLAEGDVITVVNGVDRTEGTRRIRTMLPGRRYGNPQFSLGTARIVRIDTVGGVSGILVSTVFRPVGAVRRPREVALTFDDGPWPGTTRRILGVLRRMHVKATFFVVGYLARRYPAVIRAEMRSGMMVGSHSWDHPNARPFKRLPDARLESEMREVNVFPRRRFGLRVHLFRPPGGSWSAGVVTAADGLGDAGRELERRFPGLDPRRLREGDRSSPAVAGAAGINRRVARRWWRPACHR